MGKLPPEYQGHYGPTLNFLHPLSAPPVSSAPDPHPRGFRELGIDISAGQVNRILIENKESFHREQEQVFQVGLETAEYIHTDDTGARHQGKMGFAPSSATTCSPTSAVATARVEKTICGC